MYLFQPVIRSSPSAVMGLHSESKDLTCATEWPQP
ncbi:hypothetical protein 172859UKE1_256 [Escherichia phage vB_EcoM-172859UKE1]|nr:hypothetical protein 172859UKE1_256 [Escherichia phage vB_EcoM-172859UKE1]URY11226.1 hypothetical protein [Shigella phage ESh15]